MRMAASITGVDEMQNKTSTGLLNHSRCLAWHAQDAAHLTGGSEGVWTGGSEGVWTGGSEGVWIGGSEGVWTGGSEGTWRRRRRAIGARLQHRRGDAETAGLAMSSIDCKDLVVLKAAQG